MRARVRVCISVHIRVCVGVLVGVGMCERVCAGGRGYYKGMMHYVSTHVFALHDFVCSSWNLLAHFCANTSRNNKKTEQFVPEIRTCTSGQGVRVGLSPDGLAASRLRDK